MLQLLRVKAIDHVAVSSFRVPTTVPGSKEAVYEAKILRLEQQRNCTRRHQKSPEKLVTQ